MERKTAQPPNVEEAKAHLRAAATRGEAFPGVWNYSREGLLAAFILGFLVGTSPTARQALASGVLAWLKRSSL
jgi:hypothetical protein